jgi:hypothetical protein
MSVVSNTKLNVINSNNMDEINEVIVKVQEEQLERFKKLYAVKYDDFLKVFWNKEEENDKPEWYNNPKTYFNRLRNFIIKIFKSDNKIILEKYKKSEGSEHGRLYVNGFGFQSLKKNIRNYLFSNLDFYDYDMENAHFNIFKYLIKNIPIETPILNKYINKRNECLKEWNVSKQLVLSMLNKDEWNGKGILKDFHKELLPLKIIINSSHSNICNKTDNEKNPISSVMNKILCYYENDFLQRQMKKQDNIHSLYFDGYIGNTKINVDELNETTKDENIKWSVKPFDNEININDFYDKDLYDEIDDLNFYAFDKKEMRDLVNKCSYTYNEFINKNDIDKLEGNEKQKEKEKLKLIKNTSNENIKNLMNYMNKYLLAIKGGKVSYIFEKLDKYGRCESHTEYKDLSAFKENWIEYDIKNKALFKNEKNPVELWLKFEKRRTYDEIKFRPNEYFEYKEGSYNVYNMWNGWVYKYDENFNVDEDKIKRILIHLKEVICNNNIEMYEYVLNLWKLILLGKKTGIGLGLTSLQGCGKNTVTEYFGEMILGDRYYSYIQNMDDLLNGFTGLRCFKCLIIADELDTWAGNRKDSNKLKSILTQSKTKLERKYKEALNVEDYANYVFLSNFKNFLNVEGKNDRRYLIQQCSSKYMGNINYFNELYKDMGRDPLNGRLSKKNKKRAYEIGRHFFHFLLNRDLTNFDKTKIPQTKILKDMKNESTPTIVSFVYKLMLHIEKKNIKKFYTSHLYDLYKEFVNDVEGDLKYQVISSFSKRLKRTFFIFKKYIVHKRDGSTFTGYKMNDIKDLIKEIRLTYNFSDDIEGYDFDDNDDGDVM